jgi:sugar diacid utilization regulator
MSDEQETTAYARWYAKNKQTYSEKRKERYKNDPAYRQACLERKAQQTAKNKAALPAHYTQNFTEASQALGVSLYTLRSWWEADYFPEPLKHPLGRFFTDNQVSLLNTLVNFFEHNPKPLSPDQEKALQSTADMIRANWIQE